MQALLTSSPGAYGLVERDVPTPGPDEVLVKVGARGLCHTDVIIRAGVASHVRYPVVPGHEFSGVVAECGSGVRHVRPGDAAAIQTIMPCGQCRFCHLGVISRCEH